MAKPAQSDVPEMPSAERKRLNCSRAHDHSSPWPMARCQKLTTPVRLDIRGAAPSRPNPAAILCMPQAIGENAEGVETAAAITALRPAREAASRDSIPILSDPQSKQQPKQKKTFFFNSPSFSSDPFIFGRSPQTHLHRQAQISPLRLPPSGIQTPRRQPCCPCKKKLVSGAPGR